MFVVELGEAGGHLAAARTGGGNHHQGMGGLNVLVPPKPLVANDFPDVVGVALNGIVAVDLQAQLLQADLEGVGSGLAGIAGDDHAAHVQPAAPELVNEAEHIAVVGDAQVAPDLVLFNVAGVDGNNDFRFIPQLLQHAQLAVRFKAGEHPGCVVVVKELAAKLQVQLSAKLGDAVLYVPGLGHQIFFIVEARHFLVSSCNSVSVNNKIFYIFWWDTVKGAERKRARQ